MLLPRYKRVSKMLSIFLILFGQVTQIASFKTKVEAFNIAHPEAKVEDANAMSSTEVLEVEEEEEEEVPNELVVHNSVLVELESDTGCFLSWPQEW